MIQQAFDPFGRLHWLARLVLVAMGAGMVVLLGIAVWLKPAERGYGTHTQLPGLKRCTVRRLFDDKFGCPSCGMTTSWAHFVRGQWFQAVKANSGGTLLALFTSIAAPWLLVSGVIGRWWIRRPNEWVAVAAAGAVVVVTLVDWGVRVSLAYRSLDFPFPL